MFVTSNIISRNFEIYSLSVPAISVIGLEISILVWDLYLYYSSVNKFSMHIRVGIIIPAKPQTIKAVFVWLYI